MPVRLGQLALSPSCRQPLSAHAPIWPLLQRPCPRPLSSCSSPSRKVLCACGLIPSAKRGSRPDSEVRRVHIMATIDAPTARLSRRCLIVDGPATRSSCGEREGAGISRNKAVNAKGSLLNGPKRGRGVCLCFHDSTFKRRAPGLASPPSRRTRGITVRRYQTVYAVSAFYLLQ